MSENAIKGSEAKFYPSTNLTIYKALMHAKMMNDNPAYAGILSTKTSDRLNAVEPIFRQKQVILGTRKAERAGINTQKEKARTDTAMFTSHFLQVFNMGVKRGKYSFADRVLFGMDGYSEALPSLKGDANLERAAKQVIDGEAKRIADGKTAVTNPSAAELEVEYNLFMQLDQLSSNADSALAETQKELRTLHKEGRAVVKKIWREVETYYNDGDRERMRKKARPWGVHYARKGGEKTVTGIITDAETGLPLIGVKLKFANGKNKTITDSNGRFSLVTNLMHEQNLLATRANYEPAEIIVDLKEGVGNSCTLAMVKLV